MKYKYHTRSINPADWTVLGYFYQGGSDEIYSEYRWDHDELQTVLENRGLEIPEEYTSCEACGTNFAHGAVVFNHTDGTLLRIGGDCAQTFGAESKGAAKAQAAKKAAARREYRENKIAEGLAWWNARPEALDIYFTAATWQDSWAKDTVADIAEAVTKYGRMTPKQYGFFLTLPEKYQSFLDEQAARAEDPDPAPVVEGRIEITGRVLATKWVENHFSYNENTLKMLVLDDRGFKVWGTVPKAIYWVEKGDRVTFTAQVERSQDDFDFGFFKRPTKASAITEDVQ